MTDNNITLAIVDDGYYRKFFAMSPGTNLRKLMHAYRGHLCPTCSKPELLDFWFDTAQIKDTDTPRSLGMTTGDIIDVRISEQVTRGACPLPAGQTLPNVHYLPDPSTTSTNSPAAANAVRRRDPAPFNDPNPNSLFIPPYNSDRDNAGTIRTDAIRETQAVPTAAASAERVTLTVRDQAGVSLTLRIKKSTPFRKVLDAYAKQAERDPKTCRMFVDGERLALDQTPADVECEEGDTVEVHWEQVGGR